MKHNSSAISQIKSTKDFGADEQFQSEAEPVVQLATDLRRDLQKYKEYRGEGSFKNGSGNWYNRPLLKLAYNKEMQGAYGAQNRSVFNIHEDSSTGVTQQLPLEVEFTKRYIGFTLLEVSIVLVIIGFIMGVVLFARDIIVAAKVRAVITQLERYNAATNVFRDRYRHLPGDIPYSATAPWLNFFSTPGIVSTTIGGDGNGFIHSTTGQPSAAITTLAINGTGRELVNYFNHLGALGLIDFYGNGSITSVVAGGNFPTIKGFDKTTFALMVYTGFKTNNLPLVTDPGDVRNYWYLGIQGATTNAVQGLYSFMQDEAFSIDMKIDDGFPNTGTVIAMGSRATTGLEDLPVRELSTSTATTNACIEGTGAAFSASDVYRIKVRIDVCNLRIRTAF